MSEKENSFMDDAKGFLSSWKEDYGSKNQDILDRAEKRRADAQAENEELKKMVSEIGIQFDGMAKDLLDVVKINTEGFTKAVKEGTATLADKVELEQKLKQLNDFLVATKNKGADEFKKIAGNIQAKLNNFDTELASERESMGNDALSNLKSKTEAQERDIEKSHNDIKNLFSDDD